MSVLRPVRKRKKVRTLGSVDIIDREDYADLDLDAKVELIRSLVPLGLMHVEELLDEEVMALAGARYARKDAAVGGRPSAKLRAADWFRSSSSRWRSPASGGVDSSFASLGSRDMAKPRFSGRWASGAIVASANVLPSSTDTTSTKEAKSDEHSETVHGTGASPVGYLYRHLRRGRQAR